MTLRLYSDTICTLGEGAFWHPVRNQFFWFDILGKRLLTRMDTDDVSWPFDECVSAAGWIDHDTLIIAGASAIWRFDIQTGKRDRLIDLEADNPATRSNDGRVDPLGGFWVGTMGYDAERGMGAIYRYFRGELRKIYDQISIPNAICFSVDGSFALFTDTKDGRVMWQYLDSQGWPQGQPSVYLDLSAENYGVDGAVIDEKGNFWNAQWGASRVACFNPAGIMVGTYLLQTPQASCPAFGGPDRTSLFVTTAADGLTGDSKAGQTFVFSTNAKGQAEHQVLL